MYKIIVGVEGMMCHKCENHVNDMILKSFPVEQVTSSYTEKQTVINSRDPIDEEKIREVITDMGYDFLSISVEEYKKKKIHLFRK